RDAGVLQMLTFCHSFAGDLPGAVECATAAIELRPTDAMLHLVLAEMLLRSSRTVDALHAMTRALSLAAGRAEVVYSCGMLLQQAGDHRRAAQCLRNAV